MTPDKFDCMDQSSTWGSLVPKNWREWTELVREDISTEGRALLDWSVQVLRDFYTDQWFERAMANDVLSFTWDRPRSGPVALSRHLERAARIARLPEQVRDQLTQGPNSIRFSQDAKDFDHLDVILEVMGLAIADGWSVESERRTAAGKLPDVTISKNGITKVLEVTTRGFDRDTLLVMSQFDAIRDEYVRIQLSTNVMCQFEVTRILTDDELGAFLEAMREAVAQALSTGDVCERSFPYGFITANPPGGQLESPFTIGRGAQTGSKQASIIMERLRTKAKQTRGEHAAWIRLDEGGGLLHGLASANFGLADQLASLKNFVSPIFAENDHVEGIIFSDGAPFDPVPGQPEESRILVPSGALALTRCLPGNRRRQTFLIPRLSRDYIYGGSPVEIPMRTWYQNEGSWLNRTLSCLGLPQVTTLR
jgi:hypothetical protein